jgi:hypothetical protein
MILHVYMISCRIIPSYQQSSERLVNENILKGCKQYYLPCSFIMLYNIFGHK